MPPQSLTTDWLLFTLAAPFAAAVLAPFLALRFARAAAWILAIVPLALFAAFASLMPQVAAGKRLVAGIDWLPAYGVRFSVLVDGLSLAFALLISGIGVLIIVYAGGYLKKDQRLGRFLALLFLFMGAMLGLVLADDGLMLFVFWEATSIASFLLIGFDHTRRAARRAAFQALVITGAGGLALLAALLLTRQVIGDFSLSALLSSGDVLAQSGLYLPVLLLFLGSAFTKSAQVPLHVWLPNAMEAPTPVSAYLHSATMVKAGVYLLMRLQPALGDSAAWSTILPLFGGTTLLVGALMAVARSDLKQMLAYTTLASLGLLVLLIGVGSDAAILGAAAYLIAHSLFKGALFMVAGAIDHESGTRDIIRLSGLSKAMPVTFAAALVGAVSMAGLPPMAGFVAKEALYAGLSESSAVMTAVVVIGNALMFAVGFSVALKPFLGQKAKTPKQAHEGPVELWLGPVVLGAAGLAAALMTGLFSAYLVTPMAEAITNSPMRTELHLLPTEFGAPLLLSLVTVALGLLLFRLTPMLRAFSSSVLSALDWGPDRAFDQLLTGLLRSAFLLTRLFQHGHLERYVMTTIIAMIGAILIPMLIFHELPGRPWLPALRLHEGAIFLIAALGLLAVVMSRTRLTAIVALGVQGFAVAVLFMLFGAPDLSFTQFMVETLSVVILALVMTRLSLGERDRRPLPQRLLDGTLALAAGASFTLLTLKMVEVGFDRTLTTFYEAHARALAHGRNVVNVIIVDFRGLDTLGEIAVVMIAGLCILALVRVKTRRRIPGDGKVER